MVEPTYHTWRDQYAGISVEDAKELKALREENAKLKRLVAEAGLGLAPVIAFAPEAEGWLRWCFASKDVARLGQGVDRLRRWLRGGPGGVKTSLRPRGAM